MFLFNLHKHFMLIQSWWRESVCMDTTILNCILNEFMLSDTAIYMVNKRLQKPKTHQLMS